MNRESGLGMLHFAQSGSYRSRSLEGDQEESLEQRIKSRINGNPATTDKEHRPFLPCISLFWQARRIRSRQTQTPPISVRSEHGRGNFSPGTAAERGKRSTNRRQRSQRRRIDRVLRFLCVLLLTPTAQLRVHGIKGQNDGGRANDSPFQKC